MLLYQLALLVLMCGGALFMSATVDDRAPIARSTYQIAALTFALSGVLFALTVIR